MDATHFSISHRNGQTIQIYRSDGTLHPGPRHDKNAWTSSLSAGPPAGITFGDRFIQLGNFRIGDADGRQGNSYQLIKNNV